MTVPMVIAVAACTLALSAIACAQPSLDGLNRTDAPATRATSSGAVGPERRSASGDAASNPDTRPLDPGRGAAAPGPGADIHLSMSAALLESALRAALRVGEQPRGGSPRPLSELELSIPVDGTIELAGRWVGRITGDSREADYGFRLRARAGATGTNVLLFDLEHASLTIDGTALLAAADEGTAALAAALGVLAPVFECAVTRAIREIEHRHSGPARGSRAGCEDPVLWIEGKTLRVRIDPALLEPDLPAFTVSRLELPAGRMAVEGMLAW